jgi:demethylmenaquinone methyltransferase/2-methoxy-6-polyprenyl-1,4-benzoquinol methylase
MAYKALRPKEKIEENPQAIRAMFNRIAPKYDLLNRILSLGLNRWVRRKTAALAISLLKDRRSGPSSVPTKRLPAEGGTPTKLAQGRASLRQPDRTLAGLRAGDLVLDLSTGTGEMALDLAERGARVIGLDFSQEMLILAKKKCAHTDIKFIAADAFNLPFKCAPSAAAPGGPFDLVTVGFALRSMGNVQKSLETIKGVLRPGGKVLILEFGMARNSSVRFFYRIYVRFLIPLIGRTVSGDKRAYKFLALSIPYFSENNDLKESLRQSGFQEIRYFPIVSGIYEVYVAQKG